MRILHVVHQYLPHRQAGVEIYTHSLAKELGRRHQVTVYCHEPSLIHSGRGFRQDSYEGVWVRRVAGGTPSTPLDQFIGDFQNRHFAQDYAAFLGSFRPDLVHVQHLKGLSANLLAITAQRGIPIVMTLHDYWALCPNAQFIRPTETICPGWRAGLACGICAAHRLGLPRLGALAALMAPLFWARQAVIKRQMKRVSAFISPSRFLRDRYVQAGYGAERFRIIENGLDLARLTGVEPNRRELRAHYAYIGSLAWQKGVHVLIEAFRDLEAPAELRIWGDPNTFPEYAARLRDLVKGQANIRLAGRLPRDRIGEALAWADYLIVPSLWWENSPTVILEAYAAGVPVIASRLGAMSEKVIEGVSGILFEPGEVRDLRRVLQRTIGDPSLWQRLSAGLPRVESMTEHARKIEAIYEQLLSGGSSRDAH